MNEIRSDDSKLGIKSKHYEKTQCSPQCGPLLEYHNYGDPLYTVVSLDEVDKQIGEILINDLESNEDICQIVVCPRKDDSLNKSPTSKIYPDQEEAQGKYDWVLVLTQKCLRFLSTDQYPVLPKIRKTQITNLLSIEWGKIMLQSWIEWSWIDDNHIEHTRLGFTSTGEQPMKEIIAQILGSSKQRLKESGTSIHESLEPLISHLSDTQVDRIGFFILPTERISKIVYSPPIPAVNKTRFGIFKVQIRKAIPPFGLILTDQQIVILPDVELGAGSNFGGAIRTVPITKVQQIDVEKDIEGSLIHLVIGDKVSTETIEFWGGSEIYADLFDFCQIFAQHKTDQ